MTEAIYSRGFLNAHEHCVDRVDLGGRTWWGMGQVGHARAVRVVPAVPVCALGGGDEVALRKRQPMFTQGCLEAPKPLCIGVGVACVSYEGNSRVAAIDEVIRPEPSAAEIVVQHTVCRHADRRMRDED
jgi:hypothetical protein